MVGKVDMFGNLRTPDAHAEVFKELTDSLKLSQVTEADFSSCGIGPVALGHLSEWVHEATAAVARLSLKGNFPCDRISRDGFGMGPWLPGKNFSGWIPLCESFERKSLLLPRQV